MALTAEEVRHIATLARVAVSPEEVERLQAQLSGILEHFQVLNDIDTSDVPPTAQTLNLHSVQRADDVQPSMPRTEILLNAPRTEDGYIRVRAVLD
ncbi:MAG: Asp-tRNA(Asn)/Glu-tRNA(Gln) amidotransferase subunit GatC [Dehalococcoidia bacterium]|nr:Asp-tRNA(Asn)/Glu-tRNA(Gln) amidotransferase subunit GatC [Dehalococcoidia bacterium]